MRILSLLALAACVDAPVETTAIQPLNDMEGVFEFAIDLPWRMEPHLTPDHHAVYDPVPITIAILDEDTNTYSFEDGTNKGHLFDFCKITVGRYRDGHATQVQTFLPQDLAWVEVTGGPSTTPGQPTYWPDLEHPSDPTPYNATCHPGSQDCSAFAHIRNTSEWHAMLLWDPGTTLPGSSEILELTAYVSANTGCDSRKIQLRNYARAYWADYALPRFGSDRWLYGDLHYHAQSTDNEGESGYSYRAVTQAMGAMGIDFTFATDHASSSTQIVNIGGVSGGVPEKTRGIRDLDPARWEWAENELHGSTGANHEIAARWPDGRPRIPRLFLGAEVDVMPEVDAAPVTTGFDPRWNLAYGDQRSVDLKEWVLDGALPAFIFSLGDWLPEIFHEVVDVNGATEYVLHDVQGIGDRVYAGRQHVLYIPRYRNQPDGLVPSFTGRYGGASRRLLEGGGGRPGVLGEIEAKQGIAFLAHPLSSGGSGRGPGSLPYTDYQYNKIFGERVFAGLQLWNEDKRTSAAGGDYEVTGYEWADWWNTGTHMPGWTTGSYRYEPMYDLTHWGWGRIHFDLEEQLHNGAYTWDRLLRWGLDHGRTRAIAWLDGDPRRVFMAGGSDAHGDWNYRRDGYMRRTDASNETAFAKVRNLVDAGEPVTPCSALDHECTPTAADSYSQDQIAEAIGEGKFSITDGPAIRIVVDRNRNGVIDDGDYPMGSIVELYNGEVLPLLVEWESTPEFGPVDKIDVYVGVDTEPCRTCTADERHARTYAPIDHGARRGPGMNVEITRDPPDADYGTVDKVANDCVGLCQMLDGYWQPADAATRGQLRIEPLTFGQGLHGVKPIDLDLSKFTTNPIGETSAPQPTRAYVRLFARTKPPCDVFHPIRPEVAFSGACSPRYAFTNPVWAMRKVWAYGQPCYSERGLDRDYDGAPDFCDGAPTTPGNFGRTRAFGGASNDSAESVAFDGAGNVFVAGSVIGTGQIEIGSSSTTPFAATDVDALLVAYSRAGTYRGRVQALGAGSASITGIATDAANDIYIAGYFTGSTQLGTFSLTSTDRDGFVAKLRGADLAAQWVYRIRGLGDTRATNVAVTPDGQIAVAGDFTGNLLTPGTIPSEGGSDCFVMRLTTIGLQLSVQRVTGTGDCHATGIAVDTSGRATLAATYTGTVRSAGLTKTSTSQKSVVTRFGNPAESFLPLGATWLGDPTASADVAVADVAVTSAGMIVAVGNFRGALAAAVGTGSFMTLGSATTRDGFVVAIAGATGTVSLPAVWQFGGATSDDGLEAVATDAAGHLVVSGWFQSTSLTTPLGTLTRTSVKDGMMFVYDPTITLVMQRDFGITGFNIASAAALSVDGQVAIAGTFSAQAAIDDRRTVTSKGGNDGFVAVFDTP